MVLQVLNHYYDVLASDPETGISPACYSSANVSYAVNLSENGEILDLFPMFSNVQRGKQTKEVPRKIIVPEQIKRSGRTPPPNFLCDNAAYVFGISAKNDEDPAFGPSRYKAFREFHLEMLKNAKGTPAKAVVAFLHSFKPEETKNHPVIIRHFEKIMEGGNLVFKLEGSSGFIHEDEEIRFIWENYRADKSNEVAQCLVSGEFAPVARLHTSLKGIKGSNSTGATLVGFNANAYESYNKKQGQNSPVSEKVAFSYTTALNYLLTSQNKFYLGDTTVVYWADNIDPIYPVLFADLFGVSQNFTDDQARVSMFSGLVRMRRVSPFDFFIRNHLSNW